MDMDKTLGDEDIRIKRAIGPPRTNGQALAEPEAEVRYTIDTWSVRTFVALVTSAPQYRFIVFFQSQLLTWL